MKQTVLSATLVLVCFSMYSQTRVFASFGSNVNTEFNAGPNLNLALNNNSFSLGSYTNDYGLGKYLQCEVQIEKRFFGIYYWVTGLKMNQTGYHYAESPYTSDLKNTYLSVPLLMRINYQNANSLYIDLGFQENYLASAKLKESFFQLSDNQNIARHFSRFSTSFYFEITIAIKRFGFSVFSQSKTFGSSKDFAAEWGLPRNRSLFLLYYQNFVFHSNGLKLTYRLL
jgi:hypothetical protein